MEKFNYKHTPSIAIDIGTASIKAVELSGSYQKPTLDSFACQPLVEGAIIHQKINKPEQVVNSLRQVARDFISNSKKVLISLTEDKTFSRTITVESGVNQVDLDSIVELEVENIFPFPREDINIDYYRCLDFSSNSEHDRIEVVACLKTTINQVQEILEAIDLHPQIIDVDIFSVKRIFQYVRAQTQSKKKIQAVVDFGSNSSRLMVFDDGRLIYKRDLKTGGRQLLNSLCQKYHTSYENSIVVFDVEDYFFNYEKDILIPFSETLSQELMMLIEHFYSNIYSCELEEVIITGGCSRAKRIRETIEDYLQIPVSVLNPWVSTDINPNINSKQLKMVTPMLSVATGLAIRGLKK